MSEQIVSLPKKDRLTLEGWQKRFYTEPKRAEEAAETYGAMGFEVRFEKMVIEDFGTQCSKCKEEACVAYVWVYTRKAE